jgi:hypothetical protein
LVLVLVGYRRVRDGFDLTTFFAKLKMLSKPAVQTLDDNEMIRLGPDENSPAAIYNTYSSYIVH